MSKIERDADVHRVSPVAHPAAMMAVQTAQRIYSSRSTSVSLAELTAAIDSACTGDDWNTPPVDMRTFALMVMAALQFGVWIEDAATAEHFRVAAAAANLEARTHAVMTAGAVASLGVLVNELAETTQR